MPVRSPKAPAAKGPAVCAMAKTTVNRLIAAAQLSAGRFWRIKLVIAPGAMKTQSPNTTAEITTAPPAGRTSGSADPIAMPVRIIAKGLPEACRANTPRQTKGEAISATPMMIHTAEISSAGAC